jgi:uroporphyrinogen-III synthase
MSISEYDLRPAIRRPLYGKQIVVTRAAHQAAELTEIFWARAAVPLLYPCLAILPVEDFSSIDESLIRATQGEYDWLVITSANTVDVLFGRLQALHIAPNSLHLKVAAVGSTTAKTIEAQLNLNVTTVPSDYQGQALINAISLQAGALILLPQGEIAPVKLFEDLILAGAVVTRHTIYRTHIGGNDGINLPVLLKTGNVDAITFASPSAVSGFAQRMQVEAGGIPDLGEVTIACIGPSTRRAALDYDLPVHVMPTSYTLENLVDAMEVYFDAR